MVYIKGGNQTSFEQVKLDDWILGTIDDVQEFLNVEKDYMVDKEVKDEKGNVTMQKVKETRKINQVRFKFKLDGYQYAHYSRKMTASTNERSNLYQFLLQIYGEMLAPDIPVELDMLKNLPVKTMWNEVKLKNGNIFQFPDKIRALTTELPAIWNVKEVENEEIIEEDLDNPVDTPF